MACMRLQYGNEHWCSWARVQSLSAPVLMAHQWMRSGSAVWLLQAVGPQTERGWDRKWRKTRESTVSNVTSTCFCCLSVVTEICSLFFCCFEILFAILKTYFQSACDVMESYTDTQFSISHDFCKLSLYCLFTACGSKNDHIWLLRTTWFETNVLSLSLCSLSLPSHSSVMVGRWGVLGELGVLRRSGRTLTLEIDHTSLSSAKGGQRSNSLEFLPLRVEEHCGYNRGHTGREGLGQGCMRNIQEWEEGVNTGR